MDKNQEEIATKYAGNSYTNINPSTSNFTLPVAPPGMCIPDCSETVSADSVRVNCETTIAEHRGDDIEACSDMTNVRPSVVDEVDSALRGQETIGTKYDEGRVLSDSTNISKNMNEATEIRMPEYMNLAINMGHETTKVLGAIPKKLPAPPVPPRGITYVI